MKTKAIGYVRVSTDKQADRGVSLEAQVEKIRAMATVHDVELVEIITDAGESAKALDRPGMVRILELVGSRAVGMVIVTKLDRLTRSVKDLAVLLEQFQRRGVSLVSVAEVAGHRQRLRQAGPEHHGLSQPMGAGGHRRADAGRHAAQEIQAGGRRQSAVWLPASRRQAPRGTGAGRAGDFGAD